MEKIIEAIRNSKSVAILPHINADGDAIGSCKSMSEVLKTLGKEAVIYAEEPIESRLEFIAEDITIYEGTAKKHDTCIVLDCGDELRMGTRKPISENADIVINIDHHKTNTNFGNINLVEADAAATGEILAELFAAMNIEFTKQIATYLYAAICSDTGSFAYSNVSPKTFRIAAELIEKDINHAEISRLLFDCVGLEQEMLKAELTGNIKSYYGGKLRLVCADSALAQKYGLSEKEIQDIVNIPRRIRGTEAAVSLKMSDGKIRVSLRSNGDYDVAAVACKFGGGGHTKAAGCAIETESLEEAEKLIVMAFGEILS